MKRSAFLQPWSREHHAALKLAKACEQATGLDAGRQCEFARQAFATELEPHFRSEERELLPLLDEALTIRLLDEHRVLHAAAEALQPDDVAALHAFGKLLSAHVRFEERELFEYIERRIDQ